MKRLIIALALLCAWPSFAEDLKAPASSKEKQKVLFYEDMYGSRTGIKQFYDILSQMQRAIGDLPPDIQRLAMYNLRVDRDDFTPGMMKFFQGKIEETFIKYGRRQIVAAPELRSTRIVSTDTSFVLSNTLPTQNDLWKIGEALRLDGFIEGNLTRSEMGDIMLSLKVFRHKSAEVVWSGSFVSGPNEDKYYFPLMDIGTRLSFGYWPVSKYTDETETIREPTLKLDMYQYAVEFTVSEAANSNRRLYLGAAAGLSFLFPVADNPRDSVVGDLPSNWVGIAGADLVYVFVAKENFDDGYWLGAYLGMRVYFPQKLIIIRHGYSSRISRHFILSAGLQFMPLLDQLIASKSLLSTTGDYELKLQNPTYEVSIQYAY
jgi:hypothetical protein